MAEETAKRQTVGREEFEKREYLTMKIGSSHDIVVKQIYKAYVDEKFALSGVDFRYEIITSDDKVITVGAWKLYEALCKAFATLPQDKTLIGTKLRIAHPGNEEYTVEVLE